MTVTLTRMINCDARGVPGYDRCPAFYEGLPAEKLDQVRKDSRKLGWTRSGGFDYCPEHPHGAGGAR